MTFSSNDHRFHCWVLIVVVLVGMLALPMTGLVQVGFAPAEALGIEANFDGASIGTYTIGDSEINFTLATESLSTGEVYTYWTYFKVTNTTGKEVTFRVTNADAVNFLSTPSKEAQMVYSYDGDNWLRFTNHSYSGGTCTFTGNFTNNQVYVATFFPFTYTEMQEYTNTVDASPWAVRTVLGSSQQGRNITLLKITNSSIPDDDKKVIYIIGRQHSAETCSSHMLRGMIDYLVSDNATARRLRNDFVWYIVPIVNPDGVYLGYSRATSELRNANRDWKNNETVETNIVRDHISLIDSTLGVDFFIDWHSQMDDTTWANFVYSPSGNTFDSILGAHTDFDIQYPSTAATGTVNDCTAREWISWNIIMNPMYVFEPTPHLYTWTKASLEQQGVNVAYAINEYFPAASPIFEIVDSQFEASADSVDLRANTAGTQDWYESRGTLASALTLDQSDVTGNTGKKAALKTYSDTSTNSVYLSQEFSSPQTGSFSVSCDINIDQIFLDSQNLCRGGYIFLGNDNGGTNGPNSGGAERFVQLAFWDSTPGTDGDIKLVAREENNNDGTPPHDPWLDPSTWNEVATGLSYDTWYNIRIEVHFVAGTRGTYDVYVNGVLAKAGIIGYEQYLAQPSITHISFAIGGVSSSGFGRGDFYVDNVYGPAAEQYTLTVTTSGSGSVTKSPDKATYNNGESVQLTAIADSNWSFSDWSGDLIGYANPTTITMDGNKTVTATFTATEAKIKVVSNVSQAVVGQEFTVYINVTNVEDLYGWELQFDYDPSILDLTYNDTVAGGLNTPLNFFKNSTDEVTGHLWWAMSSTWPTTSGIAYADHAIFEMHFKGIAAGICSLNLSSTILSDSSANPISHTVVNGSVTVQTLDLTVDSTEILNKLGTEVWLGSIYANDTYADSSTYYYPVNVTISNTGTAAATGFKVKLEVYYDTTLEASGEKPVTSLPGSSSLELTFTDVFSPVKTGDVGRYGLKATVDSEDVIVESDESNNLLEKKDFVVTVMGDTKGDKTVNILDGVKLALAWGGRPGYPQWNVYADLNHDDEINILDGTRIGIYWGTSW